MDVDLEAEMKKDAIVIQYLKDVGVAKDFYQALCNMRWKKRGASSTEDRVLSKLKGEEDPAVWSCSWRYAGGIIAEIRNNCYYTAEDYMNFYCSGNEGLIKPLVKECFDRMGWEPHPWNDDGDG